MADFLLGLILSVLVGGAAFFLLRSNASWSLSRRKKADAVEVLPYLSNPNKLLSVYPDIGLLEEALGCAFKCLQIPCEVAHCLYLFSILQTLTHWHNLA